MLPETSDYTSLQERLGLAPKEPAELKDSQPPVERPAAELMAFAGAINENTPTNALPHNFAGYLEITGHPNFT